MPGGHARAGVPPWVPERGDQVHGVRGDWAGDRESRGSTRGVLEKLAHHCITCSQTVIARSSGEAESYAL